MKRRGWWADVRRRPRRSGSPKKFRLVSLVSSLNREVRAMRRQPLEREAGHTAERLEERGLLEPPQ